MIDQRFMQSLADDMKDPMLGEETAPDTMLASGLVTSDVPQTGVRLGRAGVTPQQSAKAGGLDRPAMALLDTLAGALQGATSQVIGLPGDIRSIIDAINQEGAEKYLGKRVMPTTEEVQAALPSVVPQGVANQAEREFTAKTASDIGTFLPAPGIPEAVVKGGKMIGRAVQATKNMPVGMSTQIVGEGVSDLGFYSAAKQAVDSIQQPKGTGEQFLKQIEKTPGVKPEEIKWTGLDDFLKSKKSVTKAEVQEFLDKNRVEVKEVQLGGGYATMEKELNRQGYELNVDMDGDWSIFKNNEYVEFEELPQDLQQFIKENGPQATETKFSKYTLPGGENYREILITLPFKEPDMPKGYQVSKVEYDDGTSRYFAETPTTRSSAYKTEEEAQAELQRMTEGLKGFRENLESFKSQHFDQPNILAHMRVNDRVDKDGKKVLFIEEVQSDWHQAGRKKGYKQPDLKPEDVRAEFIPPNVPEGANPDYYPGYYEVFNKKTGELVTRAGGGLSPERAIQEAIGIANATKSGVPDAPFKTTWHELAMKRAIQLAAEGGYDRVAFTTGKTQAERYDLSKQIANLRAEKITSGTKAGQYEISATDKNGKPAIYTVVPENELDGLIGKDLAKKIIDDSAQFPDGKDYSGLDLQVGGEGMKGFYDQILPKFLDKYAKKWDAKTGQMNMFVSPRDGSVPINYIDVTPKMKESVLTKGQPLFAIGASGAAVQQEENQ